MTRCHLLTAIVCSLTLIACKNKDDPNTTQDTDTTQTTSATGGPTYYQDIAPLLSENCSPCHVEGGIEPDILFDDSEITSILAPNIADAVSNRRMPPFYAAETDECEIPWGWSNDPRLSDEEIALIVECLSFGETTDEDVAKLRAYAEEEQLLEHAVLWDLTRARGTEVPWSLIQTLAPKYPGPRLKSNEVEPQ